MNGNVNINTFIILLMRVLCAILHMYYYSLSFVASFIYICFQLFPFFLLQRVFEENRNAETVEMQRLEEQERRRREEKVGQGGREGGREGEEREGGREGEGREGGREREGREGGRGKGGREGGREGGEGGREGGRGEGGREGVSR